MSRRVEKVSEVVREVASQAILFELADPRIRDVTVVAARVTADLRHAKVFVSIMGDEQKQKLAMHGLNSARGFLQRRVAQRLATRYTPVLEFVLDEGVKKSLEMSRLLREVLPAPVEEEPAEEEGSGEPGPRTECGRP